MFERGEGFFLFLLLSSHSLSAYLFTRLSLFEVLKLDVRKKTSMESPYSC